MEPSKNRTIRRRGLVLLAVPLLLAVLTASLHTRQERSSPHADMARGMSVAAAMYDEDAVLAREVQGIADSGAGWIRVDFDWSVAEPARGEYDWHYIDRVTALASAHGLEVLAVLDYAPVWVRPPGTSSHGEPEDVTEFSAFAQAAAERYAPRGVRTWEVWNEPNVAGFWEPIPDPARYADLLRLSASAIHRVERTALVMSGGLSPTASTPNGSGVAPLAFLRALYAKGAMTEVDAVAVHPYTFPAPPTAPDTAFSRLPLIRDLMVANGDGGKQVWITEFGVPTGSGDGEVSEAAQAAMLTDAYNGARQWTWIGGFFFYQLRDSGTDTGDVEQNFGLLRNDYSAKPAWGALRRLLHS